MTIWKICGLNFFRKVILSTLRLITIDRWFSFCIIPLQSSRCQPNGNFDTAQCIEQVIEHLVSQTSHLLKFFTINSNFVSCKIVRKKSFYDFFIFPDQAWWLPSRLHRRPMFLLWWGGIMIFLAISQSSFLWIVRAGKNLVTSIQWSCPSIWPALCSNATGRVRQIFQGDAIVHLRWDQLQFRSDLGVGHFPDGYYRPCEKLHIERRWTRFF